MRMNRVIAVLAATASAVALWAVARIGGVDLAVDMGQGVEPITLTYVVVVSLQASLLGWASLALLERFAAKARMLWLTLAGLVLALSFLPVVSADATSSAKTILALMHVSVAGVLMSRLPSRDREAASARRNAHSAP